MRFHTYHLTALSINIIFHVALFIIGFQYASQFSISSHVESSISCQHNKPSAAVPPTYFVLMNKRGEMMKKNFNGQFKRNFNKSCILLNTVVWKSFCPLLISFFACLSHFNISNHQTIYILVKDITSKHVMQFSSMIISMCTYPTHSSLHHGIKTPFRRVKVPRNGLCCDFLVVVFLIWCHAEHMSVAKGRLTLLIIIITWVLQFLLVGVSVRKDGLINKGPKPCIYRYVYYFHNLL